MRKSTMDAHLREPLRLYRMNWIPLTAMGALLAATLAVSRFSFQIEGQLLKLLVMSASFIVFGHYLVSRRWGARPGFALLSMGQLTVLGLFGPTLTYVAASANLPLQDAALAHFDMLLGLDWPAYYNFFVGRPALLTYAILFYAVFLLPPVLVPLVLGFTRNYVRLQRFVMASVLTICATVFISIFVPAVGTYHYYGLAAEFPGFTASGFLMQLEPLSLVRAGLLRVFNMSEIAGIITFPSFHASAAILALWAVWAVWWLRPVAVVLSGGMLIATPLLGGHYFVDVFAGVALAFAAIYAATALGEWDVVNSSTTQACLAAE